MPKRPTNKRSVLQRARESNRFKEKTQKQREAIVGKKRAAQQNRADFLAPTEEARGRLAVKRVGEYKKAKGMKAGGQVSRGMGAATQGGQFRKDG
jgi:hypothetical protein